MEPSLGDEEDRYMDDLYLNEHASDDDGDSFRSAMSDLGIQDDPETPRGIPTTSSVAGVTTTDVLDRDVISNETAYPSHVQVDLDLMKEIKGMYRILNLVNEQGSGGLVDKVIISQESLGQLVNDIYPGAYVSMTRIDFSSLDTLLVKPCGIYGSRTEIVRFLSDVGAVDTQTASCLHHCKDDGSTNGGRTLRSGLYILRQSAESLVYVIYWPEETTWDDNATLSVQKNRVTFMRFLMKIADQLIGFISEEQDATILWSDDKQEVRADIEDEKIERLHTFQVEKTSEQEEHAAARPGFTLDLKNVVHEVKVPLDCSIDPGVLIPRLVVGETACGVAQVKVIAPRLRQKPLRERPTRQNIQYMLDSGSFRLSETLSGEALQELINLGICQKRDPQAVSELQQRYRDAVNKHTAMIQTQIAALHSKLSQQNDLTVAALTDWMIDAVLQKFRSLTQEQLIEHNPPDEERLRRQEHLRSLQGMYPEFKAEIHNASNPRNFKINSQPFRDFKKRLSSLEDILSTDAVSNDEEQKQLISSALRDPDFLEHKGGLISVAKDFVLSVFKSDTSGGRVFTKDSPDAEFLVQLQAFLFKYPGATDAVHECVELAVAALTRLINRKVHELAHAAEQLQSTACHHQIKQEADMWLAGEKAACRRAFLSAVTNSFIRDYKHITNIDDIRAEPGYHGGMYVMTGTHEIQEDAMLQYTIHPFQLTEADQQQMQIDSAWIPSPQVHSRSSFLFNLPWNYRIDHLQLIQGGRFLLIATDQQTAGVKIFLDSIQEIGRTETLGPAKKSLHQEKIGRSFLCAYDETKRMLAVCATEELHLYMFVFDERFSTLNGWGSPIDLRPWYDLDGHIKPTHAAFLCGSSEELVLVDNGGRARIYSMTTQQFRPASIQLLRRPLSIHSSPDGSCLLSAECDNGGLYLRAYHWSNFGTSDGICLELPDLSADSCVVTSMGGRTQMHFVGLDLKTYRCKSYALDIARRMTEFMFKEKGGNAARHIGPRSGLSVHNCLIDCFSEVWTKFPVVPAVQRNTVKTESGRVSHSILFVSSLPAASFRAYFHELIATFERATRKPTEDTLSGIMVDAMSYESFIHSNPNLSSFKLGEWLVDILCLIPIHIAVTRDNRFVPLKDGVWSGELERSLLGATVDQIVDNLSFGWYESIFQSYMALKPVRVVSSMGEQSVGKSFTLNHLVDTSFAGSAMRTTEGVWMSVTPTDESLIVALDFEGVHSIERSAQEDTLLVLFNTALSNLVLFRNNFALSREIAGLFQSFQSSSTILDPTANPSLFQSTLVIIIKDVIDSDQADITKEFRLKFQKIVEVEQASNFISRLHGGKLAIIPWPVIESRQFYTLFPALKRILDRQTVTHPKAGVFLQTMKTLMAKLKANDWGSLDQNLASHRAQQLLGLLPKALAFGAIDDELGSEPLKDIDSGILVGLPDTDAKFYLSDSDNTQSPTSGVRDACLQTLLESSSHFADRSAVTGTEVEWIQDLKDHLDHLVMLRINHVREWLDSNMARFKPDLPQLQEVRRAFENLIVNLKANVKLCGLQCSDCQLSCLSVRHHDGGHNCFTSHRCLQQCGYVEDHPEGEACGLPAGHPKGHICDISAHLCGQPCDLYGKGGCLQYCSKTVHHEDEEHMCPAPLHQCGEPCSLRNIQLHGGIMYNCQSHCRIPIHEPHQEHMCETQSCPIQCYLCKRLCASPQHLHALNHEVSHLCGQEHPCSALCQLPGICRIETAPHSVEATFVGRHQTFQYTKYSQVSKRLPCVVPIQPGERTHTGQHIHSTEKPVFHFCETRCENCGYFCTLPLGHPQQEHETRHGSMSRTKWSVEGPEGTIVDVTGRKFGANDEGAPMLCSLFCREMGRHTHIDYCRSENAETCSGADLQHTDAEIAPDPQRPKDYINHALYWRRTGFKDPYSQEDQNSFAKCDSMCGGQEHQAEATGVAHPSYCTLDLFHRPLPSDQQPPGGVGHVSRDGHHFTCRDPAQTQQAYHVMFVIDRSSSMRRHDMGPLPNTPAARRLTARHNNRLGAVYSSLHAFWMARHAALGASQAGHVINRRDSYTVTLFDSDVSICVDNDFTSTPDELLARLLEFDTGRGTEYGAALTNAHQIMERNWNAERSPVLIFLSDGECSLPDETVRGLCRRAVVLGRPLSFHTVSFGPHNHVLRRMARIANEVENRVPNGRVQPTVASTYSAALDTVRLAETFLGLANSLRKARGSLMHG